MRLRNRITGTGADFSFHRTVHITPGFLKKHGIRGLILDIDNTLTLHDEPVPAEGIAAWVNRLRRNGIKLVIVSNNKPERVQPFADSLGIECICGCTKPLRKGYTAALELLELSPGETAAVGDQLFTDIWGANFSGITSIFVDPMAQEPETERFIRLKRVLEKPFLPRKYADEGLTERERAKNG
ncbi:MAG: YqeG family HAD IIIA-type phosphatase [Ruminococcus sp.]|nr:YqeG family HAD IIIA-type phosphatase [Ruminococcus sp.]